MTGAMYSAISGLQTHMSKLNVIGNNVANVNTFGYKAARTTFTESIYSSVRGGSNGSNTYGGVNPSQLGYGCSIGTIDLDMSTKNYVPTGYGLDCMINGDGFFLVGPKPEYDPATNTYFETDPQDLTLTRVGNFNFDPEGYLVDGNGYVVYGFVTTSGEKDAGVIKDKDNPVISTQLVPIRLPLQAIEDGTTKAGSAIYPGADKGTQSGYNVYDNYPNSSAKSTGEVIDVETISIDPKTGKITAVNRADDTNVVIGYIPLASVTNPNGVTHIQGPYYKAMEGAGKCTASVIGDALGEVYLNNQDGSNTSDVRIFGTGGTTLITGGLESSGTDVAVEFSEMITTQRGYQANSRIITVTDSMLEELVNIKR